ncbi:MAG: hypothetical protein HQ445_02645 [Polaromonas sp.]|nr:hypothetical protein [Polaromonas sp.]
MGYRTHGRWVIKGPPTEIIAAWAKCRLTLTPTPSEKGDNLWDEFDLFKTNGVGYIRFEFEDYKWYASFTDVQFFESVWDAIEEFADEKPDAGISGKRVHIGEDNAAEDRSIGDGYDIELYAVCNFDDHEPDEGDPL